jgi:two-component system LytT family response regulator
MKKIAAVIIDDENRSREMLQNLIAQYCSNVDVLTTADSVTSGIEAINKFSPDLLFLDIEMNKETGFDLLEQIKEINFEVIFTTAHENYALKAFKFCAIDYLLKPIAVEDLIQAVDKVEKKKSNSLFREKFDLFMHNVKKGNNEDQRLAVSTTEGLVFINVSDILRCEANGAYTYLHLKDKTRLVVSKNLKEYEQLLSDHNFLRVHNSFIINMKEIKKYVRGDGGYVIMSDDTSVDISKRKKELFLSHILKA